MNNQSNSPQPADPEPGLPQEKPAQPGRSWDRAWERLVRLGLGEIALRVGTGLASIALILLVVWVMGNFYLKGKANNPSQASALAATLPTATGGTGAGPVGRSTGRRHRQEWHRAAGHAAYHPAGPPAL